MGKRGEGWFLLQMLLFAAILLAPDVVLLAFPVWLRVLGLVVLAIGGVFGTSGMIALGRNLTPFPKPIEGGTLITSGVYGVVRHPIYTGLILGTLGWALWHPNLLGIGLAILLFIFFDVKSRREERWLVETYPAYAGYRQRVKKLIPRIY